MTMERLVKIGRGTLEEFSKDYADVSLAPGCNPVASQKDVASKNEDGTLNYEWVIYYTAVAVKKKEEKRMAF